MAEEAIDQCRSWVCLAAHHRDKYVGPIGFDLGACLMAETRGDKFDALAWYNAERSRGIVHTADYDARMADLQREWDEMIAREG